MKTLSLQEIHNVTLEVMDRVHQICEENDIRYNLMYGTLLGAVRHQGFIPWDDDLDICMLREDYNRFCEITSKGNGRYRLANRANTKDYYYGISRYYDSHYEYHSELPLNPFDLGIFIDLYPLDSCGKTPQDSESVFRTIEKKNSEYCCYCNKRSLTSPWRNLVRIPYYYYLHMKYGPNYPKQIDKDIEEIIYKQYDRESPFVGIYWDDFKEFRSVNREDFLDQELVPFEGRRYWIPKRSKEFLSLQYGDYMKLPPENERVASHNYCIYEKTEP